MKSIKDFIEEETGKKGKTFLLRLQDVEAVPPDIMEHPEITEMVISCPHPKSFDPLIFQLPNLRSLMFYNLTAPVPEQIGQLKTLTHLYLYKCNPTSLPESMGDLSELQEIKLERLGPTYLPASIGRLRKLKTLIIENSPLMVLPDALCELDALEAISLYRAGLIGSIPDFIFRQTKLKSLDIRNNEIEEIPPRILELSELKKLQISNNPIGLGSGTLSEGLKLVKAWFASHTTPLGSDRKDKFALLLKNLNQQLKAYGGKEKIIKADALSPARQSILEELLVDHLMAYKKIAYEYIYSYFDEDWGYRTIDVHVHNLNLPDTLSSDTRWSLTLGEDSFTGIVVVFDLKGWEVEDATLVG